MIYTRKIIILICFCGLIFSNVLAQITIGSKLKPNAGTLLDLKEFESATIAETGTKGLLLPRVKLVDVRPPVGELSGSIGGSGTWVELEHTGLMVYNVVNTKTVEYARGAYPGVYLWTGSEWLSLSSIEPVLPPEETTDEFIGSNCYILATGGNSVEIPGKRGLDIWQAYTGTNVSTGKVLDISELGARTSFTVQTVWQEANDASNTGVVASVEVDTNSTNPMITVTSGTKSGNALISLSDGTTGNVIWMWHIWVAESDPTVAPIYFTNAANKNYWLMQSNLGAFNINKASYSNASPATASSHGLYYQWGRHVPFRQFVSTLTFSPNSGISEKETLTYALQNPYFIKYFDIVSHDWYSNNPNTWNTRWAMENAQGKNIKSPFDPCPYGWRIPSMESDESIWQGLDVATVTQVGSGIDTAIGYFPYSGYLADGDGQLGSVGTSAYIWSGDAYLGVNATNLFVKGTTIKSQYGMNKADAVSVRCVRDVAE